VRRRRLSGLGDSELEALTRQGDETAYAELWKRHSHAGLAAARQFSTIADPDDIVSEAYLHIFRALQRGTGPTEAFRPYLYRTIRNVALGWVEKTRSLPLDEAPELIDPAPDPETATIRSTITVRAFRTLPERWQTVLWYTEVEGMAPAEAAPLLGMTPNATAALAYRAREGLKKAWLQAHVNDRRIPDDCRWTTERMGDFVRGSLTPAARARFESHLRGCTRCPIVLEEIDHVNGRLAVILLPLALGGAAAAGLVSGRAEQAPPAASQGGTPLLRRGPVRVAAVTAAAVGIAATGIAFATAPTRAPETPNTVATQEPSTPPEEQPDAEEPAPGSESTAEVPEQSSAPDDPATPRTGAPRAPGAGGTTTPPTAPPVAPPAPVITAPASGTLTNDPMPTISGSGLPGVTVQLDYVDADGSTPHPLGSTTVSADGLWTFTPTTAVPDGDRRFRATQLRSGLASPPATVALTIDTVAAPPTIAPIPSGVLVFIPELTGTAEPDAAVELFGATGRLIASGKAAGDGSWTIDLPDDHLEGETITAVQTDPAGNVSDPSAATPALQFAYPGLTPADGSTIASTGGATIITLLLDGIPGNRVEVFVDGVSTGNMHTLEATPILRVTKALPDGVHTLGVRYVDGSGGRGPIVTHTVTITP